MGENKIIVGRNEKENKALVAGKTRNDYVFEVPDIAGPISLLQGKKTKKVVEATAALTAFYSDARTDMVAVCYGGEKQGKTIIVERPSREAVEKLRL